MTLDRLRIAKFVKPSALGTEGARYRDGRESAVRVRMLKGLPRPAWTARVVADPGTKETLRNLPAAGSSVEAAALVDRVGSPLRLASATIRCRLARGRGSTVPARWDRHGQGGPPPPRSVVCTKTRQVSGVNHVVPGPQGPPARFRDRPHPRLYRCRHAPYPSPSSRRPTPDAPILVARAHVGWRA
jgi:hypothetical protein